MVYPGPWIQDPDYTQDATVTDGTRTSYLTVERGLDAFPRAFADNNIFSAGGPMYVEDGTLMEIMGQVVDDAPLVGLGNSPQVTDIGRRSMEIAGSGPPTDYNNYGYVAIGHSPYPICYWSEAWAPSWPAEAIGVEYQNHPEWTNDPVNNPFQLALDVPRVAVSLLGTTTMQNIGSQVMVDEPYTCSLGLADWGRAVEKTYHGAAGTPTSGQTWSLGSFSKTTIEGISSFSLGFEVPLTNMLDLELGGLLYTGNEPFARTSINGYGADWSYGSRFLTVQLRETYRPPVYRFIYEGEPVITGRPDNVRRRFT